MSSNSSWLIGLGSLILFSLLPAVQASNLHAASMTDADRCQRLIDQENERYEMNKNRQHRPSARTIELIDKGHRDILERITKVHGCAAQSPSISDSPEANNPVEKSTTSDGKQLPSADESKSDEKQSDQLGIKAGEISQDSGAQASSGKEKSRFRTDYVPGMVARDPVGRFSGTVANTVTTAKVAATRWNSDANLVKIEVTGAPIGQSAMVSPSGVKFRFVSPSTRKELLVTQEGSNLRAWPIPGDVRFMPTPIPDNFIDFREAVELMMQQGRKWCCEIHATLSGITNEDDEPDGARWTFEGEKKWAVDAVNGTVITMDGVPVGYDDKIVGQWLPLASKGDVNAQLKLGQFYEGKNVPEAIKWYKKAAEQGLPEAQWKLGTIYYRAKNRPDALKWLQKAADQGSARGQYALGSLYHDELNFMEAIRWFQKAAEQRDAAAENSLGVMHYYGRGVPQDFAEAKRWFQKAATHQLAVANQNIVKLEKFLALPPNNRHAPNIGILKGTSDGDKKGEDAFARRDYEMANVFWKQAEQERSGVALHNQALLYVFGLGVIKNHTWAQMKFQDACHRGLRESCRWKDKLIQKAIDDCDRDPACRAGLAAAHQFFFENNCMAAGPRERDLMGCPF